jgi:hypothetical protein
MADEAKPTEVFPQPAPPAPEPVQAVQSVNQGGVGETKGGTDPSPVQPKNVTTDVRPGLAGSGERFGSGAPATFVGFPQTKYHPVYGKREVVDPNEAATVFTPPHDWFDTPGEADMHRTEREAQQVIHYNQTVKVEDKVARVKGEEPEADRQGIVRNSVQAQESLDAGTEPVI